jgi:GNAT superfamily N-acetyltransferase
VSRRIVSITLDNLDDLPGRCRSCVFWELDPVARDKAVRAGDPALEKEAWVSNALLEWGSCGKLAYVDGVPAGYVMFAPPNRVPRSVAFPTAPISADAVHLMTAHVVGDFAGQGIGRHLVQTLAKDTIRRGYRAIEAFGTTDPGEHAPCVLPADMLTAVGFKTVRAHPRHPRLRLELRTAASWREEVEVAIDRLLGSLTGEGVLRPAGVR